MPAGPWSTTATVYRLTAQGAIPATLQALLAARLDALEPSQKLGLQHVAVIGEAATVEQVAGLGSTEAATTLRSLVDVGLLRHGPDGRYDTVDSLLREVAYETLPHNVRGELHRQAAVLVATPEERARHLDRAATYLADDENVAAEAVEALVAAGTAFIESSRHLDALRLLERALALGCLPSSALLDLAKLQALSSRDEDALRTLALIQDDPDDPAVAVERDHTAGDVDHVLRSPRRHYRDSTMPPAGGTDSGTRPRRRGHGPTPVWPISTSAAWRSRSSSSNWR